MFLESVDVICTQEPLTYTQNFNTDVLYTIIPLTPVSANICALLTLLTYIPFTLTEKAVVPAP